MIRMIFSQIYSMKDTCKFNSFGGDSVEAKNEFIGTKCK
jgi:hypothetical protein